MSSDDGYSYERCYSIMQTLQDEFKQKLPTNISLDDLNQLDFSCYAEYEKETSEMRSEMYSKPMVWIGVYIAVASLICILAMAADLLRGLRDKKFWFPCKYFFLNAASITVIAVAMKLPVDLSGDMPTSGDEATKVGSLGFMCTMMANLMPSLALMDNKTLLANVIDNEMELSEKIMKRISNSLTSFISKAENEQNNNLLELVKKSTGFRGVQIFFESDHVQPLLPFEFVNSWSLPIITLTCIAIALPNIHVDEVESFLRCVSEGISFTQLVDESLYSASGYVNHLRTIRILWPEVEHKRKWLDKSLVNNVFKSKTSMEIVKWFSDKAKKIVIENKEGTHDGELMENPPPRLIVANSMYQITQTILFRYQSNIEPINQNQLFTHLKSIVADIFSACFTNIPHVIRLRCHDCMIEKRETSVKVAAKLLGKTIKIIERLETLEIPSMDDDKMAYIDEWRLYLKQSIP